MPQSGSASPFRLHPVFPSSQAFGSLVSIGDTQNCRFQHHRPWEDDHSRTVRHDRVYVHWQQSRWRRGKHKTTTLRVLTRCTQAVLQGKDKVALFDRQLPLQIFGYPCLERTDITRYASYRDDVKVCNKFFLLDDSSDVLFRRRHSLLPQAEDSVPKQSWSAYLL